MEVYNALGGTPDFLLGMSEVDRFVTAMRARQFDAFARAFLARNPGGLVVEIGSNEGLMLRALVSPLKIAHFDDHAVDRSIYLTLVNLSCVTTIWYGQRSP